LTILQPSHAKLPRLTRRLALLAVDAEDKGADGIVRSGLLRAVMHDLGVDGIAWPALAAGGIAVPALIAVLTTVPQWSTV
jgi:hypothetical protein